MALIKLKQIEANLSYDTGSNTLFISGALSIQQTDASYPALSTSGSTYIVDSPGIASASFNTSGSMNVDIIDGGTY
jgi:hypothetical protein